ncbi:MAG: hypothetical protein QM731_25830 [Chitinophagaceae bacterium]
MAAGYLRRLSRLEQLTPLDWILIFLLIAVLHVPALLNNEANNHNAYLMLAQSLLKGRLSLPPGQSEFMGDMIYYHGDYYLPYPPLPAIILTPLVAIFGSHVNAVLVGLVLSCISFYLLYKILQALDVKQEHITWLMVGFFVGTGYWYVLFTSHHVYGMAHVVATTCMLAMIHECLYKKRWLLVGLFVGLAFLARQFTLFSFVAAAGFLFYQYWSDKKKLIKNGLLLSAGTGLMMLVYMWYNYARFGAPLETGYQYVVYIGVLKERVDEFGVFSTRYFLFNLYSLFIKGFNIEFTGNGLIRIKDMDLWGTSLLAASPFVVASVRAVWPTTLKIFTWLSILIIMTGVCMYHNNGFHQVNTMRFAIDFLPLLYILVARGVQSVPNWLFRGMVVYAVLLNVLSFVIHFLYQQQ